MSDRSSGLPRSVSGVYTRKRGRQLTYAYEALGQAEKELRRVKTELERLQAEAKGPGKGPPAVPQALIEQEPSWVRRK